MIEVLGWFFLIPGTAVASWAAGDILTMNRRMTPTMDRLRRANTFMLVGLCAIVLGLVMVL